MHSAPQTSLHTPKLSYFTQRSHKLHARIVSAVHAASDRSSSSSSSSQQESSASSRRQALQALVASVATLQVGQASAAESVDLRVGEIRHTDAEWRQILSPNAYAVLRQAATERPLSSPLYEEHRVGVFCCAGCGSDLFPSSSKYESGTGWPSFYAPIPGAVDTTLDASIFFMPRTEVRCHKCQGHLGHVFPDGPQPTGLRYCMNGAAMTFKPQQA